MRFVTATCYDGRRTRWPRPPTSWNTAKMIWRNCSDHEWARPPYRRIPPRGPLPYHRGQADRRHRPRLRTPRRVREAFVQVHRDTAQRGCAAAHYRLSGPDNWPRFCVVQLPESWRLVMSFPEVDTVAFLILDKHDNRTDPYIVLEEAFN